jgi:hypothetical protein
VGSAIALGLRRFLPLFGATLLVGLMATAIALPVALMAGIGVQDLTTPTPAVAGRLVLVMLVLLAVLVALWVRFMLMTPAAAAGAGGPIAILKRSWHLTKGHSLRLIGFFLLLLIATFVVTLAITLVIGIVVALVAGDPEPGSISALIMLLLSGVLNAAFLVVLTTAVARIYAQLDDGTTDVPASVTGDAIGT